MQRKPDNSGLDKVEWQANGWMLTAVLVLKLGPMASIGCLPVVAGIHCFSIKTEWNTWTIIEEDKETRHRLAFNVIDSLILHISLSNPGILLDLDLGPIARPGPH